MESPAKVNIATLVDASRLGGFQWTIFGLCGLCLIMDGFDVQAMGYVAPAVIREFNVPSAMMGRVLGAALVGVLIGSYGFSMLADKIGRRPVLIFASIYFSLAALWTARAESVNELLAIRLLAGIGMGGIMPNAMALAGEYSPSRVRVTVMMVVANFFTVGAAIGGFIASALIPRFGWRSVFVFGGIVPLAIAVAMIFLLPESLQFLVQKNKDLDKVRRGLSRINAPLPVGEVRYVMEEENRAGMPLLHLFREGRAAGTLLLWVLNFMNLANLYFLGSWLPTVVRDQGYTTAIAVLVGTAVPVGGSIGAIANGWLIDRLGFRGVLTVLFGVATVSVAMIGQPALPLALLFTAAFIAGWCIPGAQSAINSLAAVYYPTYLRSTGIGSGLGFGRIGAIVGPVVAGILLGRGLAHRELFLVAAVPALISAVCAFTLRWVIREPGKEAITR
ncbi:MAG: MFS transporter [Bryobacterales bacterium]|nr:MFS transporter [Bryobacterales bacterium]